MHNLYYSRLDDTGIYMYNTDSCESVKIFEDPEGSQCFTLTYDGEYIWLDDTIYKDAAKYLISRARLLIIRYIN